MLHFVVLGGLALLAAGCASQKNPPGPTTPRPKPRPPEPEEASLTREFAPQTRAWQAYQQLKEAGILDTALDQGCPTLKILPDGKAKSGVEGSGDGKLSACEIQEYSLNHYFEHPEFAEIFTGKPIPWSLDDHDPKTSFDEGIRKGMEAAIDRLKKELEKLKIPSGSPEYQERLATGLTYLLSVPGFWKASPEGRIKLAEIVRELEDLDLKDLADFLQRRDLEHGFLPAENVELTALEALQQSKGNCTEKSKILFDMFKRAGLDPFFVYVDLWETRDPFILDQVAKNPGYKHVCLGLKIGDRIRLFDPSLVSAHPPHGRFYPLTPRQYLAHDVLNHGMLEFDKKNYDQVHSLVDQAHSLGESFGHHYTIRGLAYFGQEQWEKAEREHSRAIEINPREPIFWANRGLARDKTGDVEGALQDLNQALSLNPSFSGVYFNRGSIYIMSGREDPARTDFIKYLSFGTKIGPTMVANNLMKFYESEWEGKAKEKVMNLMPAETDLKARPLQARVDMLGLLWQAGKKEEAREEMEGLIKVALDKKAELTQQKKQFSPETLNFLSRLYDRLPAEASELKDPWQPLFLP